METEAAHSGSGDFADSLAENKQADERAAQNKVAP